MQTPTPTPEQIAQWTRELGIEPHYPPKARGGYFAPGDALITALRRAYEAGLASQSETDEERSIQNKTRRTQRAGRVG
jgi:hypothetical protein